MSEEIVDREKLMRETHNHMAVAAKGLYVLGFTDEMKHQHTLMDILQGDHAEFIKTHFPITTKK